MARPRTWTDDDLAAAIAQSDSWSAILRFLKLPRGGESQRTILRHTARLGLSVEHLPKSRRQVREGAVQDPRRNVPDEEIALAIENANSWMGVIRALGFEASGASQSSLRQRSEQLGLSTDHFRGMGWRRGLPSERRLDWQAILVSKPFSKRRVKRSLLYRALIESGVPEKCAICGLPPMWQGKRLCLPIDHIDGDFRNNGRENLRFLCPNCHTQTETWGSKPSSRSPTAETAV